MAPIDILFVTLSRFVEFYSILLIITILLSWFPTINWYDPPFSILRQLTDPYLNLFRNIIPPLGGIDFSPLLALLLLSLIQNPILQLLRVGVLSIMGA